MNHLCWNRNNPKSIQSVWCGTQRAKITEKVHKPPRNHYIEWPVFYDISLNCESQGEKGRTWKKYKIMIRYRVSFFFLYMLFLFNLPRGGLWTFSVVLALCAAFGGSEELGRAQISNMAPLGSRSKFMVALAIYLGKILWGQQPLLPHSNHLLLTRW